MPITFACSCGKTLRVHDDLAGRKARCPACQAVVVVPACEPAFEVVEDDPPPRPVLARPVARPPARDEAAFDDEDRPYRTKVENRRRDDEEDRPRRRRRDEDDEEDERPRRRRKRSADKPQMLEGRVLNSGMIGGIVAMLIAVVWFVAGLFGGIIFFYPPILFVIGLIAFIKGMISRE